MNNYIEFNRKLTSEFVEIRRKKGVDEGVKKRHSNIVKIISRFSDKYKPLFEIGVREGFLFDHLCENGYIDLYGIDISPEAIDRLHERGYKGHVADAAVDFEVDDRTFNTVIISHCLEHVPEPDKVVNNIYNVLDKDGVVYVEVPKQPKEPIPTKFGHYYCFSSPQELIKFFPESKWKLLYSDNEKSIKKVFRKK